VHTVHLCFKKPADTGGIVMIKRLYKKYARWKAATPAPTLPVIPPAPAPISLRPPINPPLSAREARVLAALTGKGI
jgi:hypothetical protein